MSAKQLEKPLGPDECAQVARVGHQLEVLERRLERLAVRRGGACLALVSLVRTSAQFSKAPEDGNQAMSGAQWATATRALLETREALYPQLSRVLSQRREADTSESWFAWVLDGIAARIEQRKRTNRQ